MVKGLLLILFTFSISSVFNPQVNGVSSVKIYYTPCYAFYNIWIDESNIKNMEWVRDTTIFDKNFTNMLLVYISEFEKTDKYSEYDSIRNRISAKMLVEIRLNNGTFSDYLLLNIHGEVHFKNKIIEPDLSFLSLLKKAVPDFDCPWNMY
jgi:hypothetical protein